MNNELTLSHMSLPRLLQLEADIKVAKQKLVETVKVLPIVNIVELKLWNNGDRIHAIKAYRERTMLGLYESRQAFMLVLDQNPANAEIK